MVRAATPKYTDCVILITARHVQEKPVSLKHKLDESVKLLILILLNFDTWVCIFLIFSVIKWKIPISSPFAAYWGLMVVSWRALWMIWVVSWTSHFFSWDTDFIWQTTDWQTNCGYSDLGIWQTFSWEWVKWGCHFKRNK